MKRTAITHDFLSALNYTPSLFSCSSVYRIYTPNGTSEISGEICFYMEPQTLSINYHKISDDIKMTVHIIVSTSQETFSSDLEYIQKYYNKLILT